MAIKKRHAISVLGGLALWVGTNATQAAIGTGIGNAGFGGNGGEGELFLEVWDGQVQESDTGKTATGHFFIKDLGIRIQDILDNPAAVAAAPPFSFQTVTLPGSNRGKWLWAVRGGNDDGSTADASTLTPSKFSGDLITLRNTTSLTINLDPASLPPFNGTYTNRSYVELVLGQSPGDSQFDLNDELDLSASSIFSAPDIVERAISGNSSGSPSIDLGLSGNLAPVAETMGMFQVGAKRVEDPTNPGFFSYQYMAGGIPNQAGQEVAEPIGYWTFDGDNLTFSLAKPGVTCKVPWSTERKNPGDTLSGYVQEGGDTQAQCDAALKQAICGEDGKWSDETVAFQNCFAGGKPCDLPWGDRIGPNLTVTAYSKDQDANCANFSLALTCNDGSLKDPSGNDPDPSFNFQQCRGLPCDLPWGGTLADGASTTAYRTASNRNCDSLAETRSCSNGKLTGSFPFKSCEPAACDLPWGGTIPSGGEVTAYPSAGSTNCSATAEIRRCANGDLSGSAVNRACDLPISMIAPNGKEVWQSGIRQLISWKAPGLPQNQRVSLEFSKDNGQTWRRIKSRLRSDGLLIWKPGRRRATTAGLMRVCVPGATRKAPPVCDVSDQPFSIETPRAGQSQARK